MARSQHHQKRLRVRSKSLAEIDETKLSLALWLIAKRQLEEADAAALDEESSAS